MRAPSSLLLALGLLLASSSVVVITITNNAEESRGSTAAPAAPIISSPETSPPAAAAAWSPVTDVNDRTIQQVGQFAVAAYFFNTGTELVFVNVVSGQQAQQPYNGGDRYRLVITAAAGGPDSTAETSSSRYSVSVWGVLGTTTWQLWSFAPIS